MSPSGQSDWRARVALAGLVLSIASLPLAGCTEVEEEESSGYVPAKLEPIKGKDELKRVSFTAEGVERTGLQTAAVRRAGKHKVVPYAALIYDAEGKTYVYTSHKAREYVRREVAVDRIDRDRVLLTDGPGLGMEVVTVGAAEVYGTELEIGD